MALPKDYPCGQHIQVHSTGSEHDQTATADIADKCVGDPDDRRSRLRAPKSCVNAGISGGSSESYAKVGLAAGADWI